MFGVSEQKYIEKYAPQNKNGNSTNTGGSVSSNTSPPDETVSKVSISQSSPSVKSESEKNSRRASAELDNRYMSAVNSGDMVTTQRMMDDLTECRSRQSPWRSVRFCVPRRERLKFRRYSTFGGFGYSFTVISY